MTNYILSSWTLGLLVVLSGCTQSRNPQTQTPPPAPTQPATEAGDAAAKPDAGGSEADVPGDDQSASEGGTPQGNGGVINAGGGDTVVDSGGSGTSDTTDDKPQGNGGVINSGRPDKPSDAGPGKGSPYKAAPAGYGPDMVQQWVTAHQTAKGQGYKYVFIPPAVAANAETANVLRVAAGKAWNHLSWQVEIDVPEDISEGHGLAFALNAQKVWGGDAETNWGYIANCTPKGNIDISPAPRGDCQEFTGPTVEIPRFVYNAVNGGPYANIHKTPPYYDAFMNKFNPGPIQYVSTHKEAIVCGPRITAYRPVTVNGVQTIYSFSSDEFDGRDGGNINYQNAPSDQDQRSTGALNAGPGDGNTAIASEWWMQLPNGFFYWGIHGEGSQERGKAEFPFAVDPANWKQGADLATGRSCITCHSSGVQSAPSDAEFAGRNGWTSNEQLTTLYNTVRGKFQGSMRKLVDALSDGDATLNERLVSGTIEPVSRAILLVEGPFRGDNYACESFCNGKFGTGRKNFCSTMPAR